MKWKTWAVLVVVGAVLGIWMYRYWQQQMQATLSVESESTEAEPLAKAS